MRILPSAAFPLVTPPEPGELFKLMGLHEAPKPAPERKLRLPRDDEDAYPSNTDPGDGIRWWR